MKAGRSRETYECIGKYPMFGKVKTEENNIHLESGSVLNLKAVSDERWISVGESEGGRGDLTADGRTRLFSL